MIKVEKIEAFGYKNCVRLSANGVEAVVTTDVGPRIISYKLNGKEHLCQFTSQLGTSGGKDFVPYGGHRVWHAPELEGRTNVADNSPCHYNITDSGVTVCSDPDKSGIIKGMDITIDDAGVITIDNILKNTNLWDCELSVWGITQFACGGLLAAPNSRLNTGLVANRAISMWSYSKMNDPRVYWGDKFITVTPDSSAATPFKFGASCDEQYAAYFNNNQLIVKEFEFYYDADYPNYYCNFESYTCAEFIEIESLSPMFTLEAGDEARHTEKWYGFDNISKPNFNDENAIGKVIETNFERIKKDQK